MSKLIVRYSDTFYHPESLLEWAERYYKKLPKHITALVSRGSSGCAIATAILLVAQKNKRTLSHFHLSKGETHNGHYSGVDACAYTGDARKNICIVDDFVSSGKTLEAIVEKLVKEYFSYNSRINPETPMTVLMGHKNPDDEQRLANKHNLTILHANGEKTTTPKPPKPKKKKEKKTLDKAKESSINEQGQTPQPKQD